MLTGRQKIEAAFSREGPREFAATVCWEDVFVRDHWDQLTVSPWYDQYSPDVDGRCTLFGNLDTIGILQNGSDTQLRDAITEQIAAGRRNRNRFVVCLGSPVTPATPVDRVRLYCDLVREMSHDR